jgi:hypothetical protein
VEFCTGGCEEWTWAREDEESPLLAAAARERLVKTTVGWKRLSGCSGDLWIVETSGGAVTACSSESCVWVVNKSIHQSKPRRQSHIHVTVSMLCEDRVQRTIAGTKTTGSFRYPNLFPHDQTLGNYAFTWEYIYIFRMILRANIDSFLNQLETQISSARKELHFKSTIQMHIKLQELKNPWT